MWKGHEFYLCDYSWAICEEWTKRGFKDECFDKICSSHFGRTSSPSNSTYPPFISLEKFHLSHQSNLIRKNPSHYRPIFGPDIPDNLPYYWPSK